MKNTLLSFGLAGLTATLLSFTSISNSDEVQEPKKDRHIRMTKIENGKKMELDTVLTTDDVFVWNGDTINPLKHMKKFRHPGFDQMHQMDVTVDHKDGKEKVMIFRHNDGKPGEPMIWHTDSDSSIQVFSEAIGDSLQRKFIITKRMKDGGEDHLMFGHGPHKIPAPPVPPVPPVPHFKFLRNMPDGWVIDLNDPDIITYKKKDLKGGREKIEIIRKKSEGRENRAFDFSADVDFIMPPVPDAPEFEWEFESGDNNIQIIEKDKDGKEEIEINKETEPKENK